jgi:hypothetical protein
MLPDQYNSSRAVEIRRGEKREQLERSRLRLQQSDAIPLVEALAGKVTGLRVEHTNDFDQVGSGFAASVCILGRSISEIETVGEELRERKQRIDLYVCDGEYHFDDQNNQPLTLFDQRLQVGCQSLTEVRYLGEDNTIVFKSANVSTLWERSLLWNTYSPLAQNPILEESFARYIELQIK